MFIFTAKQLLLYCTVLSVCLRFFATLTLALPRGWFLFGDFFECYCGFYRYCFLYYLVFLLLFVCHTQTLDWINALLFVFALCFFCHLLFESFMCIRSQKEMAVFFLLGFVVFRLKDCEVVSACVVEHSCPFQVVGFIKDAHVSVRFNDSTNKNCVVARG